jgi:uncharacterized protein
MKIQLSRNEWAERIVLALFFAGIGFLIIAVFSPYRPMLSRADDFVGRIVLIGILLVLALLARRSARFVRYWQVLFGLFIMALAVSLDLFVARFLVESLGLDDKTLSGIALQKLNDGVSVAIVVLLFTRLSGSSLGSIYVQKGDLKSGLWTGFIAFAIAAAGSIPITGLMFTGRASDLATVLNWIPWILICVLSNALNEELLFRGLFLRKLEPFFGGLLSIGLIALVFTALHIGVTYPQNQKFFIFITFPLALVWGAITHKTQSIWGSVLFHAGTDIPIFLSIFSQL